jgi:hypothetical protein
MTPSLKICSNTEPQYVSATGGEVSTPAGLSSSEYQVINNFLSPKYHEHLLAEIGSDNFPWFMKTDITKSDGDNNVLKYGFQHTVINPDGTDNSSISDLIRPFVYDLLDVAGKNTLLRFRIDMQTARGVPLTHTPHVDMPELLEHTTCVYYLNDSDGDTILYENSYSQRDQELKELARITPKANSLVMFKGKLMHTGEAPIGSARRIIFNINII